LRSGTRYIGYYQRKGKKTMPRKTSKKKSNEVFQDDIPSIDESPELDSQALDSGNLEEDDGEPDPFEGLFIDFEENIRVTLERQEPESFNDQRIDGYLEDLKPGLNSYESYIAGKYGGGAYQVTKRQSGRFVTRRNFRISGPPKLTPITPTKSEEKLPEETVEGVNIGGDDKQFLRRIERFAQIQHLLNPPQEKQTDINAVLLEHILRKSEPPDITGTIQNIASLAEALKSMAGGDGAGAGTTWLDIVNQGISAFTKFVDKSSPLPSGAQVRPGQIPAIPRPVSGQIPDLSVENNQENNGEKEELNQMPRIQSNEELAQIAVANIVSGWRLEPPKEPDRIIRFFDQALKLDTKTRTLLKPYKDYLFDCAELQLEQDFAEAPEKREDFKTYFDQVFDEFVNPEREVKVLG